MNRPLVRAHYRVGSSVGLICRRSIVVMSIRGPATSIVPDTYHVHFNKPSLYSYILRYRTIDAHSHEPDTSMYGSRSWHVRQVDHVVPFVRYAHNQMTVAGVCHAEH